MSNYILGFGGKCCPTCVDNPCKGKPVLNAGSGTFYVGIFGSAVAYSSGSNLDGATWSMTAFDGLSINSSGIITGTVPTGPAGSYTITVTATNACGSTTCPFYLTLIQCSCPITLSVTGGPESYSNTVPTTGCGYVNYTYDMFSVDSDQLLVYADSTLVYDSGCVLGTGSGTFFIPPGTSNITVIVNAGCAGPSATQWSFSLFCT